MTVMNDLQSIIPTSDVDILNRLKDVPMTGLNDFQSMLKETIDFQNSTSESHIIILPGIHAPLDQLKQEYQELSHILVKKTLKT